MRPIRSFRSARRCAPRTGESIAGCNIEVASYPEGWCAEATMLGHYVMGGGGEITEIAVVAESMAKCHALRRLPAAARRIRRTGRQTLSVRRDRHRRRPRRWARCCPLRLRRRHLEMNERRADILIEQARTALTPRIAIVLGSGLGGFVDEVENADPHPLCRPARLSRRRRVRPCRRARRRAMFGGVPVLRAGGPRALLRARRRRRHAPGRWKRWRLRHHPPDPHQCRRFAARRTCRPAR